MDLLTLSASSLGPFYLATVAGRELEATQLLPATWYKLSIAQRSANDICQCPLFSFFPERYFRFNFDMIGNSLKVYEVNLNLRQLQLQLKYIAYCPYKYWASWLCHEIIIYHVQRLSGEWVRSSTTGKWISSGPCAVSYERWNEFILRFPALVRKHVVSSSPSLLLCSSLSNIRNLLRPLLTTVVFDLLEAGFVSHLFIS